MQFADDTTAVLADTSSAARLFELLNKFEALSGLKIKWPDEPMKALGVYFTYDQKLLKEKNFIERLDSIKKLIKVSVKENEMPTEKILVA